MRQHHWERGPQAPEDRRGVAARMPPRTSLLECPAEVQHCTAVQMARHDEGAHDDAARALLRQASEGADPFQPARRQRRLILSSLPAGRGG